MPPLWGIHLMSNPARKNYGKGPFKKGDVVYLWGRGTHPYRIKKIKQYEAIGGRTVHQVVLETTWGRRGLTTVSPNDIKLAPPGEEKRFLAIRKDYTDRRKAGRDRYKNETDAAKAELQEFVEFCNQNPTTALDGELWERFRKLSDRASTEFRNAGCRVPPKWT